ncbi:MAG TPA: sigma-70 family RNA polymerase sigma factor [Marmoricola sp.]|nr:sigma-70 family RNA polymerase sigma factor [Marmoricola sp.]
MRRSNQHINVLIRTTGGSGSVEPTQSNTKRDLFVCLRDASLEPARRRLLRAEAIERHLAFVEHCARDMNLDGNQREDVLQAGREGLIHAVDRFDPDRGIPFVAFARPTITGEMLRYLRDSGSSIRLPRRHRDITHAARASEEHLRRTLGREPRRRDVAQFLGMALGEVDAAFAAEDACAVLTLQPFRPESGEEAVAETSRDGCVDRYLENLPDRIDLETALARLTPVERRIIHLYIYEGYSQTQIGARLGMSQVQVSRTFQRSMRQIKAALAP